MKNLLLVLLLLAPFLTYGEDVRFKCDFRDWGPNDKIYENCDGRIALVKDDNSGQKFLMVNVKNPTNKKQGWGTWFFSGCNYYTADHDVELWNGEKAHIVGRAYHAIENDDEVVEIYVGYNKKTGGFSHIGVRCNTKSGKGMYLFFIPFSNEIYLALYDLLEKAANELNWHRKTINDN